MANSCAACANPSARLTSNFRCVLPARRCALKELYNKKRKQHERHYNPWLSTYQKDYTPQLPAKHNAGTYSQQPHHNAHQLELGATPAVPQAEKQYGGSSGSWAIGAGDGESWTKTLFSYQGVNSHVQCPCVKKPQLMRQPTAKTRTGQVPQVEIGNPCACDAVTAPSDYGFLSSRRMRPRTKCAKSRIDSGKDPQWKQMLRRGNTPFTSLPWSQQRAQTILEGRGDATYLYSWDDCE